MEHLESQVKVPKTAANSAQMEDKEAQLEEFRELGVKLANAIDGSFKVRARHARATHAHVAPAMLYMRRYSTHSTSVALLCTRSGHNASN